MITSLLSIARAQVNSDNIRHQHTFYKYFAPFLHRLIIKYAYLLNLWILSNSILYIIIYVINNILLKFNILFVIYLYLGLLLLLLLLSNLGNVGVIIEAVLLIETITPYI